MAIGYLIAALVGAFLVYIIWRASSWMRMSADKLEMVGTAIDCFYEEAEKLLHDDRTPQHILEFLNSVSLGLDDPAMIRRVVWRATVGRLRADAKNPPEAMREFLREFHRMPEPLRAAFGRAMGCAFLATALLSGIVGEIFLRFMLPNPKGQPDTATTLAAEVAGSCPAAA